MNLNFRSHNHSIYSNQCTSILASTESWTVRTSFCWTFPFSTFVQCTWFLFSKENPIFASNIFKFLTHLLTFNTIRSRSRWGFYENITLVFAIFIYECFAFILLWSQTVVVRNFLDQKQNKYSRKNNKIFIRIMQ